MSSLLVPLTSVGTPVAAAATGAGTPTNSYYETSASSTGLFVQGKTAGEAAAQGIVILDFGRPASDGTTNGTLDFSRNYLSFTAITNAVENYIMGYYLYAPDDTRLDVAVGTNNSCGLDQPCGSIVCGCPDEPASYLTWGQALAHAVEQLGAWSAQVASTNGFTDTVHVVAADDAEPAFDPGFNNTRYVMQGYAQAVTGSYPPMVDYGSADPGFWSDDQLLQVANGFAPNVAMPEIYDAGQTAEWAALVGYAKARYGEDVTVYGVMTRRGGPDPPQTMVADLLGAVAPLTGQSSLSWVSAIAP